jgi:mxaJ protein
MYSRCLSTLLIAASIAAAAERPVLRVCADPDNLPFSNRRGEGFENRLAELMARELGADLQYTWFSQRRLGFIRNSMGQGDCDALMSAPSELETVAVTKPYYRSSYVFVTRKDRKLRVASMADPRFSHWRIGVQLVGDDYAPPAWELARRGLVSNVQAFRMSGPYGEENPQAKVIHAVAEGDVDVAIAWGPLAGFFARREKTPLEITAVPAVADLGVPFAFDISMAVRKGNDELKAKLNQALERQCSAVRAILTEYGVPVAGGGDKPCGSPGQLPVLLH